MPSSTRSVESSSETLAAAIVARVSCAAVFALPPKNQSADQTVETTLPKAIAEIAIVR